MLNGDWSSGEDDPEDPDCGEFPTQQPEPPPQQVQASLLKYRQRLSASAVDRLEAAPSVAFEGKPGLARVFLPPRLLLTSGSEAASADSVAQKSMPCARKAEGRQQQPGQQIPLRRLRLKPGQPQLVIGPAGSGKSHLAAKIVDAYASRGIRQPSDDDDDDDEETAAPAIDATCAALVAGFDALIHLDCASAMASSSAEEGSADPVESRIRDRDAVRWVRENPHRLLILIDCAGQAEADEALPTSWLTFLTGSTIAASAATLILSRSRAQLPAALFQSLAWRQSAPVLRLAEWSPRQTRRYIRLAAQESLPQDDEIRQHFSETFASLAAAAEARGDKAFLTRPWNLALAVTLYNLDPTILSTKLNDQRPPVSPTLLYDLLFRSLFSNAPSAAFAAAEAACRQLLPPGGRTRPGGPPVVVGAAATAADSSLVVSGPRFAAFLAAKRLCLLYLSSAGSQQLGDDGPAADAIARLCNVWQCAADASEWSAAASAARDILNDVAELLGVGGVYGPLRSSCLMALKSSGQQPDESSFYRNEWTELHRLVTLREANNEDWTISNTHTIKSQENIDYSLKTYQQDMTQRLELEEHKRQQHTVEPRPPPYPQAIKPVTMTTTPRCVRQIRTRRRRRRRALWLDFEAQLFRLDLPDANGSDYDTRVDEDSASSSSESSDSEFDRDSGNDSSAIYGPFAKLRAALSARTQDFQRHGRLTLDRLSVRFRRGRRESPSVSAGLEAGLAAIELVERVSELRVSTRTSNTADMTDEGAADAAGVTQAVCRLAERNSDRIRRLRIAGDCLLAPGWLGRLGVTLARMTAVREVDLEGGEGIQVTPEGLSRLKRFAAAATWSEGLRRLTVRIDGFGTDGLNLTPRGHKQHVSATTSTTTSTSANQNHSGGKHHHNHHHQQQQHQQLTQIRTRIRYRVYEPPPLPPQAAVALQLIEAFLTPQRNRRYSIRTSASSSSSSLPPPPSPLACLRIRCRGLVSPDLAASVSAVAEHLIDNDVELGGFGLRRLSLRVDGDCRDDCLLQLGLLLLICPGLEVFRLRCRRVTDTKVNAESVRDDLGASYLAVLLQSAMAGPDLQRAVFRLGEVPGRRLGWLADWLASASPLAFKENGAGFTTLGTSPTRVRLSGSWVTEQKQYEKEEESFDDVIERLWQQLERHGLAERVSVELD